MRTFTLEICANSYASALAAEIGGATRIELCENMAEGGTTPSYGQVRQCKEKLKIAVWPIIRPRGGDFLYTADEFEIMKFDIRMCRDLNCDGIVTGILLPDGNIDVERCRELVELASPMPVAFHRAFDRSNDLFKAAEQIIETGMVRILTSGGCPSALAGAKVISALVKLAGDRIEIMPGAGINPSNIAEIRNITGAVNFHSSAKQKVESKMRFKQLLQANECEIEQSSAEIVSRLISALKES